MGLFLADAGYEDRVHKITSAGKRNIHCMAENPSPSKEVSLDLARELLIAISESLPENLLSSEFGEEPANGHAGTSVTSTDKDEALRSELISISYAPSPEKATLPANGHM